MASAEYVQYQVELVPDEVSGRMAARIPALSISDYGPDATAALGSLQEMAAFRIESLLEEGMPLPEPDEGAGAFLRLRLPPRAETILPRSLSPTIAEGAAYVQYKVTFEWDEETRQVSAIADAIPIADYGDDAASALERLCDLMAFDFEGVIEAGQTLPESDEGEGLYIRTPLVVHAR